MEEFTSADKSYKMYAFTNAFFTILCYSVICHHNTAVLDGYIYTNYVIIFIMHCIYNDMFHILHYYTMQYLWNAK